MKISVTHWSLFLTTATVSAWINLWAGVSSFCIVVLVWLVLWQLQRGLPSTIDLHGGNEERLIQAVHQLRANPYEGEVFGFNSRVQEEIREIIGTLGEENELTKRKVAWDSTLPALAIGLQTVINLSVITWSTVRFDQWGIITLVLLPSLTYPLLSKLSSSRL